MSTKIEVKKAEAYNLLRAMNGLTYQTQQLNAKLKEVDGEIQKMEAEANKLAKVKDSDVA